jgi:pantetheine-phosphate adenylyltransferase
MARGVVRWANHDALDSDDGEHCPKDDGVNLYHRTPLQDTSRRQARFAAQHTVIEPLRPAARAAKSLNHEPSCLEFVCVIHTDFRYNVYGKADEPMKNVLAIYPGSFDPVTNGHLDLIDRGAKIFDRLSVSILRNLDKDPLFTIDERVEMLREVTQPWPNVEVDVFSGLLVEYAQLRGANVILRGIRAVSDYEYELQMAMMNRKLNPNLETVFMMPAVAYSYLSSRLVREIAQLGGPITGLVPPAVEQRLRAKVL